MRLLVLVLSGLLLLGCTRFDERHYFTSETKQGDQRATNYFRVRVRGGAALSSARYVAGYYDERAVDLFFNEMKTAGSSSKLFHEGQKDPGSNEVIRPLSPKTEDGAFVMILSTNSQAVANTIGNFAESNVVAEAITNLVNRGKLTEIRRAESELSVKQNRAKGVAGRIQGLLARLPANGNRAETREAYLRVLNVIAETYGARQNFTTVNEAAQWFATARQLSGQ